MKNKNKRTKRALIRLVTGSLVMCMLLSPEVKANKNDINKLIKNKTLNVENQASEIEKKAIKEIRDLRFYAEEKKEAYIKKISGKSQEEIDALIGEAKTEYLKEILEKANSESKILEGLLAEVKTYPELDKNNADYRVQRKIWDDSKNVSQANIDNYKKLIKEKIDISKIKDIETFYDQFSFYVIHSQIEIMTRKVAMYRAKYPNNAEIEKIFKEKLMQTDGSNYGTDEGKILESYFNNDFKVNFLKIQEIVKFEDLKEDLVKLIQEAKDKKNTENYDKKEAERKNKFEAAIASAENLLARQDLTIKDIEKELTSLANAIKEIEKEKGRPEVNPMPKPEEKPGKPKEKDQDAAPLVPSFEKGKDQDSAPLIPSFEKGKDQDSAPLTPSHKKTRGSSSNTKTPRNPKTSDPGILLAGNTLLISLGALAFIKKRKK